MSRLGRDYLKVGMYMETMRKMGVRLIAVNDGVDSFSGDDDFTPFRNIMNEWYARDIIVIQSGVCYNFNVVDSDKSVFLGIDN